MHGKDRRDDLFRKERHNGAFPSVYEGRLMQLNHHGNGRARKGGINIYSRNSYDESTRDHPSKRLNYIPGKDSVGEGRHSIYSYD